MLKSLRCRVFGTESVGPTAVVGCDLHGHSMVTSRLVLRHPTRRDLDALMDLLDAEAFANNGLIESPEARRQWARAIVAGGKERFCADHRETGELVASWSRSAARPVAGK